MLYVNNLREKYLRKQIFFNQMILKGIPFRRACIRRMIRGGIMGAILVLVWRIL